MDSQESDNKDGKTNRRAFLEASSVALLGLTMPSRGRAAGSSESLAVLGGPKAVTFPSDKIEAIVKWPQYGAEEKQAICWTVEPSCVSS